MRSVQSRLVCPPNALIIGLFGVAVAQLSYARAQEATGAARTPDNVSGTLIVRAQGCPSAELVRALLSPLVAHERTVRGDASTASTRGETVEVRDLGDDYAIVLAGAERSHHDPARDCKERARVAAVFIALNLQEPREPADSAQAKRPPSAPAPLPLPAPEPGPEDESPKRARTPFPAQDERLHIDLGAAASVALTPSESGAVAGGALDVSLRLGIWQLGLRAGLAAESKLAIAEAGGGQVALLRIPGVLFAGVMWRISRVELGPVLGLALDGLRVRGRDLLHNESSWRANLGGYLGVQGQVFVNDWLAFTLLASSSLYPRSYELRVEPDPRRAHSPHVWFTGQLGLMCRLR